MGAQGGGGGESDGQVLAAVPSKTVKRASLNVARAGHTATLLPDGRVLVIGGESLPALNVGLEREPLDSVEIYDPVADLWTELAPLPTPRNNHTATLLPDGLVLIVGGGRTNATGQPSGLEVQADALLYDPTTGASESLGPNVVARHGHLAAALPSGKVLIAAGAGDESEIQPGGNPQPFGNALASAELYDPATRTFEATGSLEQARYSFASVTLADGRVLIAGGASAKKSGPVAHATAEVYDENTGSFEAAGAFDGPDRMFPGAARLEDGRVVVYGGIKPNVAFLDDAQVYDPTTNGWIRYEDVPPARTVSRIVPTLGGGAVIIGGYNCTPQSCDALRTAQNWSPVDGVAGELELERHRALASATVFADGSILVVGGFRSNSLHQVELLYP